MSYLTKSWFWQESVAANNITFVRDHHLPKTASVVAQNNIVPHISHRDKIYSLYPEKQTFYKNSPCGKKQCNWFRWYGDPQYLFVDTSQEWDARHLLENREDFIDGLHNLEKTGTIVEYKKVGTSTLYQVKANPENVPL
jgi:hypothetical protein